MTGQRPYLLEFSIWVIGSAIGWMTWIAPLQLHSGFWIICGICGNFSLLVMILPPIVTGCFQMLAIKPYLARPRRWVLAVSLGLPVIALALSISLIFEGPAGVYSRPARMDPFYFWLIMGALAGGCAGLVQLRFIEKSASRLWTTLWLVANAGSWGLIIGFGSGVIPLAVEGRDVRYLSDFYRAFDDFIHWLGISVGQASAWLLLFGITGALFAAVTGALMLSLVRPHQIAGSSTRQGEGPGHGRE